MIYDTPILICKLPDDAGAPIGTTLEPVFRAFCAQKEVYHARFWESVQAGSRVDILVELPMLRNVNAGMFAQFQGHVYSVEQAQFGKDADGLPITTLSLKRPEAAYDIAAV